MTSKKISLQSLRNLKSLLLILPVNDIIIEASFESGFNDFEDAIQYNTAKENDIEFLITRNKKKYKKNKISICTAEEYLKIWASQATQVDL